MSDCVLHEDGPEATVGYLCVQCFSRLRSTLLSLPAVATWLEVNIAAGGVPGERVSGSREDPIPLRVDVTDLIGPVAPNPTAAFTRDDEGRLTWEALDQAGEPSIFDELRSWALLVREETQATWTGDDRHTLTGAVTFLSARLSWIAEQPWVDEFYGKVTLLHTQAHRVVPWRPELRQIKEPCEDCGVRAMVAHIAEGFRRCEKHAGGCGRRKTLSKYELNVLLPETRRAG